MDDDESVADGGTEVRSVQHDLHRSVHAADEPDLHHPSTVPSSGGARGGLDPLLRLRLELLAGVVGRFVSCSRARVPSSSTRRNNDHLFVGAACLLAGLVITAIDLIFPHQFSTILEVDYDTPYDRHVIIEESDTRNVRRKVPKIEDSFGDRIMRCALAIDRSIDRLQRRVTSRK